MSSIIIGVFDGVHSGHQELIKQAKQHGECVALTFYPHPTFIFAPERTPAQLLTLSDRISLLEKAGADRVVVEDFNQQFASLSPDEFISEILIKQLGATHITVGKNFTFGHKAAGNAEYLRDVSGIPTTIVDLGENRGTTISSTRIRNLILDGDVDRAKELLTRPHRLVGPVVHGEKRGRTIGYPTANIGFDIGTQNKSEHHLYASAPAIPADGVYAGWLEVEGKRMAAAISIGTNPTFPGVRGRQVEAFAIGQEWMDLYDKQAILEFGFRLRDTLKFDSLEALLEQMNKDCEEVSRLTSLS
jgi:riboflavin kinase/FMN adenylyltransferase